MSDRQRAEAVEVEAARRDHDAGEDRDHRSDRGEHATIVPTVLPASTCDSCSVVRISEQRAA